MIHKLHTPMYAHVHTTYFHVQITVLLGDTCGARHDLPRGHRFVLNAHSKHDTPVTNVCSDVQVLQTAVEPLAHTDLPTGAIQG